MLSTFAACFRHLAHCGTEEPTVAEDGSNSARPPQTPVMQTMDAYDIIDACPKPPADPPIMGDADTQTASSLEHRVDPQTAASISPPARADVAPEASTGVSGQPCTYFRDAVAGSLRTTNACPLIPVDQQTDAPISPPPRTNIAPAAGTNVSGQPCTDLEDAVAGISNLDRSYKACYDNSHPATCSSQQGEQTAGPKSTDITLAPTTVICCGSATMALQMHGPAADINHHAPAAAYHSAPAGCSWEQARCVDGSGHTAGERDVQVLSLMTTVVNSESNLQSGSGGLVRTCMQCTNNIQHPTAKLFNFLSATAAAVPLLADQQRLTIPDDHKVLIEESVIRKYMAPAAEQHYGIPASARHYIVNLPVGSVLAPLVSKLLSRQGAGSWVKVYDVDTAEGCASLDSLLQQPAVNQQQLPLVILLDAPRATSEAAVFLQLPARDLQLPESETTAGVSAAAAARSGLGPQWLLVDPSGRYETIFDCLAPGLAYFNPAASVTSSASQAAWQQQPGTSACHVLFSVAAYASGMLDVRSVSQLRSSFNKHVSLLDDAGFALSCLTTLLLEGQVSIGLCGVQLPSSSSMPPRQAAAARRSTAAAAAANHPCLARTETDFQTDKLLSAWHQAISRANQTNPVTWADIHDLASLLHHVDGYVSVDGHLFFVSCKNRLPDVNCWNLACSDLSIPFYQQQNLRWLRPRSSSSSSSNSNSSSSSSSRRYGAGLAALLSQSDHDVAAAMLLAACPPASSAPCSEIVLHYSGTHYTVSMLNHEHRTLLYFDSLGGNGAHCCLPAPEGYETVILSRHTQSAATCGPQALFVALAYVADHQGLRSACSLTQGSGLSTQPDAEQKQTLPGATRGSAAAKQRRRRTGNQKARSKGPSQTQQGTGKRKNGGKQGDRVQKHSRHSAAALADRAGADTSSSWDDNGAHTRTIGLTCNSQLTVLGTDRATRLQQALAACFAGSDQHYVSRKMVPSRAWSGAVYVNADGLVSAAYQAVAQFVAGGP